MVTGLLRIQTDNLNMAVLGAVLGRSAECPWAILGVLSELQGGLTP